MPIASYWDKTDAAIMHIDISGRYIWDEFDVQMNMVANSIARANYLVCVIVDIMRAAPMPAQAALEHLDKTVNAIPSNVELCTVNGAVHRFARTIWNQTLSSHKGLNNKVVFVDNIDEAYEVIANQRKLHQSV